MLKANPSDDWRKLGELDPYYGVLSGEKYKSDRLTDASRHEFFASGDGHVDRVMSVIEKHFGDIRLGDALDYGCGVGRITFALAKRYDHVRGLDIAPAMLAEARAEQTRRACARTDFALSDAPDAMKTNSYDLIHSYIVMQHIPEAVGRKIIDKMVGALRPGGIGAIHLTYGDSKGGLGMALRTFIKNTIPLRIAANIATGRKWNYPAMQMNNYDLGSVMQTLQAHGVESILAHQVVDWTNLGLFLFFQKGPATSGLRLWSNPAPRS